MRKNLPATLILIAVCFFTNSIYLFITCAGRPVITAIVFVIYGIADMAVAIGLVRLNRAARIGAMIICGAAVLLKLGLPLLTRDDITIGAAIVIAIHAAIGLYLYASSRIRHLFLGERDANRDADFPEPTPPAR